MTTVPGEDLYKSWVTNIEAYKQPDHSIQTVYLPKTLNFEKKGMCGSSGTVTVILNQNLGKLRNLSILPQ